MKNLYVGLFEFKLKVKTLRCMAYSEKQAKLIMCRRIAKEIGVDTNMVFDKFKNSDNVKLEVKFEEGE